jgi:hypothetical protein
MWIDTYHNASNENSFEKEFEVRKSWNKSPVAMFEYLAWNGLTFECTIEPEELQLQYRKEREGVVPSSFRKRKFRDIFTDLFSDIFMPSTNLIKTLKIIYTIVSFYSTKLAHIEGHSSFRYLPIQYLGQVANWKMVTIFQLEFQLENAAPQELTYETHFPIGEIRLFGVVLRIESIRTNGVWLCGDLGV